MKLKWTTTQVTQFLRSHLPRLFGYFATITGGMPPNQQGSSTLLTILPYAVVTRKGKQLTVVNEFRPTGQTLRDALHNGGESLRRAINIRTIYLGKVEFLAYIYSLHSTILQLLGTPSLNLCSEPCFLQTPPPVQTFKAHLCCWITHLKDH